MSAETERLRRWRLILGGAADSICTESGMALNETDLAMDRVLRALYDSDRRGSLGSSQPNVARWLGDIREYFPSSVVRVMQQDALQRLNLRQMLLEPELLASVEPDVHLVANLLALKSVLPNKTKDTARMVVRKVVDDLMRKLANPVRQAVQGSLYRAARNRRPRHAEIDWRRTIQANLRHYQKEYRTIIPENRIGFGRKRSSLRDVILCVDQSGSMAASVVYASVFGAVLASLPAMSTRMIVFDTAVVDLTDQMDDPVDLLFGVQLGGGTDINRALSYCQEVTRRPEETILVLVSDLYEGGNKDELLRRAATLAAAGVQMIALLALNDNSARSYDHEIATAIQRRDLTEWLTQNP
jgi:Mg-chelatase subunit ChlD